MYFVDRLDAARQLADALRGYEGSRPLVLAIPRGAVPMGKVIADRLGGERERERNRMKTERGGFRMLEHEQKFAPPREDSYRADEKLPDPTRCPSCNATFRKGKWTWAKAPADAAIHHCPACQRIRDGIPAGYVTLKGQFATEERIELLNLVKAREARAKAEHPLQRVISVEDVADGIQVTTTDSHLAGGIAHALHDAFHGTLDLAYSRDENLVRATWKPDRQEP